MQTRHHDENEKKSNLKLRPRTVLVPRSSFKHKENLCQPGISIILNIKIKITSQ